MLQYEYFRPAYTSMLAHPYQPDGIIRMACFSRQYCKAPAGKDKGAQVHYKISHEEEFKIYDVTAHLTCSSDALG